MPSLSDLSRRQVRTLGAGAVLVVALVVAVTVWMRSDGYRIDAALGDLAGVEEVGLEDEPRSPLEPVLLVEVDGGAATDDVESILVATEDALDDDLAHSAVVTMGSARVVVHPRVAYRADVRDATRFLTRFRDADDGLVELYDDEVTVRDVPRSGSAKGRDWLAGTVAIELLDALEGEELNIEDVRIADGDGRNIISLYRLQPNHREVLESLRAWGPTSDLITLEEGSLTIRTSLPFSGLGPLAQAARDSGRVLDPEDPRVTLETVDERRLLLGDEDVSGALAVSATLEESGWTVERINAGLSVIDVSGVGAQELPDLADALAQTELSLDAGVRVNEGSLLLGTRADLDAVAPALARAHSDGYSVSWTSQEKAKGPPDVRIFVEMPEGHSFAEDADLTAAVDVARSMPWDGTGSITLRTTSSEGVDEQEAATVEPPPPGRAMVVAPGPGSSVDEDRVREAWDATAEDD